MSYLLEGPKNLFKFMHLFMHILLSTSIAVLKLDHCELFCM